MADYKKIDSDHDVWIEKRETVEQVSRINVEDLKRQHEMNLEQIKRLIEEDEKILAQLKEISDSGVVEKIEIPSSITMGG